MAIYSLINSAASNLWRRVVALVRTLLEAEDHDAAASRRDWEEEEFVFQRRDF
jgi:hypothetical protein